MMGTSSSTAMTSVHPSGEEVSCLNVVVIGGGPVGLIFACSLAELMANQVRVQVFDHRWRRNTLGIGWDPGVQRRQQVVTLQSGDFSMLPPRLINTVFDTDYAEVWPLGPGSVQGLYPRNLRIAQLEDRLLQQAKKHGEIELHANAGHVQQVLGQTPVVVIADGAHSSTRQGLQAHFGVGQESIYSLADQPLQESCLGLAVRTNLSATAAVVLNASQRRLLLNPLHGEGYVNVRLAAPEAKDLLQTLEHRPGVAGADPPSRISLDTNQTTELWQRVQDELSLFGVEASMIRSCHWFRLGMVHHHRFVASLQEAGPAPWRTYGFLIGDAANALHIWPGRGMNAGVLSAVSLARCLTRQWPGAASRPGGFRDADFIRHEGVMQMLQYRHKSRAWRAMVTPDGSGGMEPISDRLSRSLGEPVNSKTAATDRERFRQTVQQVQGRLAGRLPGTSDITELEPILSRLSARTLHTLVASGPWDSQLMGGEEVDLDWLLPIETAQ
jgi:2-polyprenyl-6-methoxyphenol hydroxylase-like FAD-dependent oxidoreductase